ncbi:MAG TPA: uroporphyrinogen decarboxylase family protein [Candidatus Lokiarchaeia archaeon]|nr:uroporphyrinogen decarboxylase family protein [Candidatus Lokiarchaeia archaeon]
MAYFSRKNPEFLQRIIDSFTNLQIQQIQKMESLHPVAVFNGDDLGQKDRALLSPAMFHKFFFENRRQVNAAIHDLGAKSILHCCGNATELLPELVASGLDAWQSMEPASGIDHSAVKQQFGNQLSFWGAVDNNILCFGSTADVAAEVKKKIKALGANGGYIVGPAHDYLNTKVDNAIALRNAVIQFGQYPLKL